MVEKKYDVTNTCADTRQALFSCLPLAESPMKIWIDNIFNKNKQTKKWILCLFCCRLLRDAQNSTEGFSLGTSDSLYAAAPA